jgi:hypothetical protein
MWNEKMCGIKENGRFINVCVYRKIIDRWIILRRIFERQDGVVWTGLVSGSG